MYSLLDYGSMLLPTKRRTAYVEALRRTIRPGDVVVDIGAGPGFFSVLAAKLGAGHVYAVEPDVSIELAREIAARNGVADRITFVGEMSTELTLPRRADVIVSDLRGVLPPLGAHLRSIIDARSRLLRPGGALIPERDVLMLGVVESPEAFARYAHPWDDAPEGVDLRAGARMVRNAWIKREVDERALLAGPAVWTALDYRTMADADVSGAVRLAVERAGLAHGLCVWFDAELVDGVGFSNAPGEPPLIYGQAFFPFAEPVQVEAGDEVAVELRAELVGDDYAWRWRTTVVGRQGAEKARLDQSTLLSVPLSPRSLRRRAASFVPVLDENGRIERAILELCDGARTLEQIASEVARAFPSRFPDEASALARVADVSARFAR